MKGLAFALTILLFIVTVKVASHDFYDESIEGLECECDCSTDFKSEKTPSCEIDEEEDLEIEEYYSMEPFPKSFGIGLI